MIMRDRLGTLSAKLAHQVIAGRALGFCGMN